MVFSKNYEHCFLVDNRTFHDCYTVVKRKMVKDALDCAMLNNKSNSSVILSTMATAKTHGEESPYFTGWKEYDKNPYDQHMNPSGIIQMGLAENQVSFDLLEEWLYEHPEASICQEGKTTFRDTALHQDYHGLPAFREALVRFMEMVRGGKVRFDPDRIVLTAGATAATELLMFCLANPGEAFLVPTPYYPGFDRDLRWRTGVEIIPVHCHSSNDFQVTSSALEEAYHEAKQRNIRVKGILVTNPSNPLGTTLERKTLKNLLSFASEKNIHLICDEIYSGSVFVPPDFVSIAEVLEGSGRPNDSDRVHIVYSLSKDLGLPGFRVGAIYSYNDTVVTTARRMSSFTLVSSQTQHFLACMLSDEDFTKKYMKENQKRLRKRHSIMVSGLQKAGISCLKSNAGLFCWVNLTQLLPSENVDGEIKLWETILYEMGLNVSPGSSCHCIEPGWFRVCFANVSEHTLQVSLQRIQGFMNSKGRNKSNNLITAARNL